MQNSTTASLNTHNKEGGFTMRYSVIAIEREYGSGGTEIAERLAQKLGIACYGEEILERAAKKLGMPISQIRHWEENTTGSILFGLNVLASASAGEAASLTKAQQLGVTETAIILDLVGSGPCVLVGRCGAGVLKDHANVLRVFVHADMATRKERACGVYGHTPKEVDSVLSQSDKRRAAYFKSNCGIDWKDKQLYHMFLDSGKLGIDAVVDILQCCVV